VEGRFYEVGLAGEEKITHFGEAPGFASRVRFLRYLRRTRRKHPVAAKEKNEKILIAPDEGAHLPILDITHKVTSESFGGAFTIIAAGIPPDEMIPPHTHTREDECNFVLEGELTLGVGGEIVVATVGSCVLKPRGVYHALCNTGTVPVRFLEFHTPGEFENYYDEYEQIVVNRSSRARWMRTSG
jgi:mannose-6-phosphate isomerase-like protein (cupin superfamily)